MTTRSPAGGAPTDPAPATATTIGEFAAACLAGHVAQLLRQIPGVRAGDDPEQIHQARVAARRLRAELGLFDLLVDAEWAQRVRAELRWLGSGLGAVRDADVLLARVAAHAGRAQAEDRDAFRSLLDLLGDDRETALRQLNAALDSPRYRDLHRLLEPAAGVPPWAGGGTADGSRAPGSRPAGDRDRPAGPAVRALVARRWRKVRRAIEGLGRSPSDADLHRVRVEIKHLRYAADAAVAVAGKPARRLAAAAAVAQDVLGAHHDSVAAEARLRVVAESCDARAAFAAGQCAALERRWRARQLESWPSARDRLVAAGDRRWLRTPRRAGRPA